MGTHVATKPAAGKLRPEASTCTSSTEIHLHRRHLLSVVQIVFSTNVFQYAFGASGTLARSSRNSSLVSCSAQNKQDKARYSTSKSPASQILVTFSKFPENLIALLEE